MQHSISVSRSTSVFSAISSFVTWIIESGASNNIIGYSNIFNSYSTCSRKDKVRLADGSLFSLASKGFIQCSPSICLNPLFFMFQNFPLISFPLVI